MENSIAPNTLPSFPIDELADYHSLLLEKADNGKSDKENPDNAALMSFNGYYALNNTGAFFAIDTNMIIHPAQDPKYDLCLLISLDGVKSKRFSFTGTFDGTNLIQQSHAKDGTTDLTVNLTLTRTNEVYGTTAAITGSIALYGKPAVQVSGSTYNNPIPASLFAGDYSYIPTGETEAVEVMSIGTDNQLMYDNGTNDGKLAAITKYAYNLNMYYFSFKQADATKVKLIMGTAGTKGFACNDLSVNNGNVISRSLFTIPNAASLKAIYKNNINIGLINFSGYYQIPTKDHPLAFIAIQSQYLKSSEAPTLDGNCVMISYSADGTTSTGFLFDPSADMTFDSTTNTLSIPGTTPYIAINLTFTRQYNSQNGSLVSIEGSIGGETVQGSTLFNPVPLSAFSGITMTSLDKTEKITINNDSIINYTNTTDTFVSDNIVYVPLMYIVYAMTSDPKNDFVLSLGTDGLRGLACIVINDQSTPEISSVYAIDGPE